ncbi:MAG: hypothetical protein WDN69_17305 [Aliidongia sp.]
MNGAERVIYRPDDQIGLPAGAPDGSRIAFVEAFCSDRGVVCGTLKLAALDGTVPDRRYPGRLGDGPDLARQRMPALCRSSGVRDRCRRLSPHGCRVTELWCTEQLTAGEW